MNMLSSTDLVTTWIRLQCPCASLSLEPRSTDSALHTSMSYHMAFYQLLEVKKKVLIGHTGKAQVPGKSKGASDFKQISDNVSKALLLPTHHRVW